jgi:hypothetical protein
MKTAEEQLKQIEEEKKLLKGVFLDVMPTDSHSESWATISITPKYEILIKDFEEFKNSKYAIDDPQIDETLVASTYEMMGQNGAVDICGLEVKKVRSVRITPKKKGLLEFTY